MRYTPKLKELAKELCEKSGCHHKCHDTSDCVVEDDALLLINQDKSNNFDVKSNNLPFVLTNEDKVSVKGRSIEKQIEEMARILCGEKERSCAECEMCYHCEFWCECSVLHHAGYRKQSDGEWQIAVNPVEATFICSNCHWFYTEADPKAETEYKYCPYCGARMKGGEE